MRWAAFVALGMIIAACSSSDDRTSLNSAPRSRGDDDDDTTKSLVDAGGGTDAAPADSGPAPSDACKVGNLALCFGFDGDVTDGSANGLKPKIANIEFVPGKESLAASFGPASQMTFDPNQAFELPKDESGAMLAALGLDPLRVSYTLDARWDRARHEIVIDKLMLLAENAGTIVVSGKLVSFVI